MAAIDVVAANVRPLNGAIIRRYKAASTGVAIGKAVYVKSDGLIELADGDAAATAQARGVVVAIGTGGKTAAAVGDQCDVVTHGAVNLGNATAMTDGAAVYVSPTVSTVDGLMDQSASATPGKFNYIIGYAEGDYVLYVQPQMVIPTAVGD
jgi:hypothetical protein